jgi:hypothetical protein
MSAPNESLVGGSAPLAITTTAQGIRARRGAEYRRGSVDAVCDVGLWASIPTRVALFKILAKSKDGVQNTFLSHRI